MKSRIIAMLTVVALLMLSVPAGACGEDSMKAGAGSTYFFGRYPQTASGTDQTPIEWILLEERDGKALLISRYGLDVMPFNTERKLVTWEECSLRSWLNNEFLQAAFADSEQALILSSRVKNSSDQHNSARMAFGVYNGDPTEDRIFVLSYMEAKTYFGLAKDNVLSRVSPTEYAESKGAYTDKRYPAEDGKPAARWWLRSPGTINTYSTVVVGNGSSDIADVNSGSVCVRPAFWLDLSPGGDRSEQDRSERIADYTTIGNVVKFGRYEQNNNADDGPEKIEWIVLDVRDGRALLISQYVLDAKPYNQDPGQVVWEDSSVRQWLNDEFFPAAFSGEEQAAIVLAEVDNGKAQQNPQWDTDGGPDTLDRVFLLSYAEAERYSNTIWTNSYNTKGGGIPTGYAREQGVAISEDYYFERGAFRINPCLWWLRSPGQEGSCAAYMYYTGSLFDMNADYAGGGVRPAIWLDLNAGIL